MALILDGCIQFGKGLTNYHLKMILYKRRKVWMVATRVLG